MIWRSHAFKILTQVIRRLVRKKARFFVTNPISRIKYPIRNRLKKKNAEKQKLTKKTLILTKPWLAEEEVVNVAVSKSTKRFLID
jgi:hypothetical protein